MTCVHYLVEVLVEPIHEEQQQLLGVLLVVASKLLVDLAYGDLEVPRADALVQPGPQGFHDDAKLLRHLPFMAKDVVSDRGGEEQRQMRIICLIPETLRLIRVIYLTC